MKNHRSAQCALFLVILTAAMRVAEPSAQAAVIISTSEHVLRGRVFRLDMLATTIDSIDYEILQISGDGIAISFHSSGGPHRPSVTGPTISFGGHQGA